MFEEVGVEAETGTVEDLMYYNNDLSLPIYNRGAKKTTQTKVIGKLLISDNVDKNRVCTSVPSYVDTSVEIVIDTSIMGNFEDSKTHIDGMIRNRTK